MEDTHGKEVSVPSIKFMGHVVPMVTLINWPRLVPGGWKQAQTLNVPLLWFERKVELSYTSANSP
jgi:hypothetical protein